MTELQARKHLHRIWFHWSRLQSALGEAHTKDLIQYDGEYKDEAPCSSSYELKDRI